MGDRTAQPAASLSIEAGSRPGLASYPRQSYLVTNGHGLLADQERESYSFAYEFPGALSQPSQQRGALRTPAEQVLQAIKLGLEPRGGKIFAKINNSDSLLAAYMLMYPEVVSFRFNAGTFSLTRVVTWSEFVSAIAGQVYNTPEIGQDDSIQTLTQVFLRCVITHDYTADTPEQAQALLRESLRDVHEWLAGDVEFERNPEGDIIGLLPVEPFSRIIYSSKLRAWQLRLVDGTFCYETAAEAFSSIEDLHYLNEGHQRMALLAVASVGGHFARISKRSEYVGGFPIGPAASPSSMLHHLTTRDPNARWYGELNYVTNERPTVLSTNALCEIINGVLVPRRAAQLHSISI